MKTLTIHGCEPINLNNGYSQLVIEIPELFWQVQQFLIGNEGIEGAYTENYKVLKVKKEVVFIGDLASPRDYNNIFGKKILAKLQFYCTDDSQMKLYQLQNELKTIINQQILNNNLPFSISNEWVMPELFKYFKLSLLPPENQSASGIIRYVIETAAQLGDDRLFVINDMERYLHNADHIDIVNMINELHVNVLELKQNGICPQNVNPQDFHLIDKDFVTF
ncbi:type II-A CRISPR-associated protein Csn2 [Periweissella beninensis]|uniref:type II-A CRISPR-associated protein Csn2 n=1 Tax=Periweissella beninensis TaxID=504936 RepID=UPI0021A6CBF0|nr:type II-A CRISPR-associated protein Csn2 [Periweissella beninensis]MCT4396581.1 type II-A CRISPR-associated protein Csn2 [Periweissella beninensis]